MKPDFKASGLYFPESIYTNHLHIASSVFTLANFQMRFYSPCVTQVPKPLLSRRITSLLLWVTENNKRVSVTVYH